MAKAETKEVEVAAPVATAPAPKPEFVVETNVEFTVEDNTADAVVAEAEVVAEEVPLMDGFVQVNYV